MARLPLIALALVPFMRAGGSSSSTGATPPPPPPPVPVGGAVYDDFTTKNTTIWGFANNSRSTEGAHQPPAGPLRAHASERGATARTRGAAVAWLLLW